MTSSSNVIVVAAVIVAGDRFLVTRRQPGVHLEGYWEFPGGKVDPHESHPAALKREIREELASDVDVGRLLLTTTHRYPGRAVTLHFYECRLLGDPRPQLGQEMMWVERKDLAALAFPPADEQLIKLLTGAEAR
jgi:8-oxo-dGTP diphosphatase